MLNFFSTKKYGIIKTWKCVDFSKIYEKKVLKCFFYFFVLKKLGLKIQLKKGVQMSFYFFVLKKKLGLKIQLKTLITKIFGSKSRVEFFDLKKIWIKENLY